MKVYSWKTLLTTFLGGGCFLFLILPIKDFIDLIGLGIFAYLIIQGLRVSFFKEAYDGYKKGRN